MKPDFFYAFANLIRLRRVVQLAFFLFCLFAGYRFYLFFLWATDRASTYVPRPAAVEGFLPISALLGLKRLVLTGNYETVHPAGLTIFLAAIFIAFMFRKGFCGWICPVGFVSGLAENAGAKLKLLIRPPAWLDYFLTSLKYLLLFFFCYLILWKMDLKMIEAFIHSPYNLVVDAKMLLFFISPSGLALGIMLFIVVMSFFLRNFWCRYLCPYGALLGLLAMPGPSRIRRREDLCVNCGKCEKSCPAAIRIMKKETVRSPECIGCMHCVAVCPQKHCLSLAVFRWQEAPPLLLPALILAAFFIFWTTARLTGHWHGSMPLDVLKKLYLLTGSLAHPGV